MSDYFPSGQLREKGFCFKWLTVNLRWWDRDYPDRADNGREDSFPTVFFMYEGDFKNLTLFQVEMHARQEDLYSLKIYTVENVVVSLCAV